MLAAAESGGAEVGSCRALLMVDLEWQDMADGLGRVVIDHICIL